MALGKKKAATADSWSALLDDAPAQAVKDDMSSPTRFRLVKGYILAATFASPLLLAGSFVLGANNFMSLQQMAAPGSSEAVEASSPGRVVATQTLASWLSSEPSPLPGGSVLSWDGATNVPFTPVVDASGKQTNDKPGYVSEIDRFSVTDSSGSVYRVAVQVLVDPRGGAVAAGGPSIEALAPVANDQWSDGGPWPGLAASAQVSDPVATAVVGWAQAYTSGDARRLTVAVGDPNPSHMYVPLAGVESVTPKVVKVADVPGKKGTQIAQVELPMLWPGQQAPAEGAQASALPVTTMDVLIERADSAAPIVTAWGAPGSGPTLTRYGNAVTTRAVPEKPAAPAAPAPTETPTS